MFAYAKSDINNGVTIEVKPLSLHEGAAKDPFFVVAQNLDTGLVDSIVVEDILILLAINVGEPIFGVNHNVGRNVDISRQREFVPTSVVHFVASVGFVFQHKCEFAHHAVFVDEHLGDTQSGIEIKIVHG